MGGKTVIILDLRSNYLESIVKISVMTVVSQMELKHCKNYRNIQDDQVMSDSAQMQ
jgi:hypothetical protein